ncbi:MAG: hypothetical protein C4293_13050 [Nitrospiraceae bacterium]
MTGIVSCQESYKKEAGEEHNVSPSQSGSIYKQMRDRRMAASHFTGKKAFNRIIIMDEKRISVWFRG